jgi:hypothetical protein
MLGSVVALKMEAVNTSETSVSFYLTTLSNIPEDIYIHNGVSFTNFYQCYGCRPLQACLQEDRFTNFKLAIQFISHFR